MHKAHVHTHHHTHLLMHTFARRCPMKMITDNSSNKALLRRLDSSGPAISHWLLMGTTGEMLGPYSMPAVAAWSTTDDEMMMEMSAEVMSVTMGMSVHAARQCTQWLPC